MKLTSQPRKISDDSPDETAADAPLTPLTPAGTDACRLSLSNACGPGGAENAKVELELFWCTLDIWAALVVAALDEGALIPFLLRFFFPMHGSGRR